METESLKVELENHRHGKARVRVGRVWRDAAHQTMVEWSVSVLLSSHCAPAFTDGDNSAIVATDTIKNTVYGKAKECAVAVSIEEFGLLLGKHFVKTYSEVTSAQVNIIEKPWERFTIDGKVHNHGFKLGRGSHTCEVVVSQNGSASVSTGLESFALLKTTQSGFEGFIRDKFTLLPEVRERILATEIQSVWSFSGKPSCYNKAYETVRKILMDVFFGSPETGVYSPSVQNTLYLMAEKVLQRVPEVERIKLIMPNLHFIPVNMPTIGVVFEHDVYVPSDEPHGTIEASLTRKNYIGRHSKL